MNTWRWWQSATIYEILVPSFQDSDGDGLGDLPGILQRLDYLQWLGVDAFWLSPFYPTPFRDMGYDITDHCAVDPRFGTLADLDRLLDEAHRRELRVLIDWVPNHTAAEHPWFQESRSSRDNPRRDWYIWRDPQADGSPPSNWLSVFGGSVWQWDEATGQYYLHTFLDQQPDLNWHHPDVREAMFEVLRFWLDRGVDGFRCDATSLLGKDPRCRDNPPNPDFKPGDAPDSALIPVHTRNQPLVHEVLEQARLIIDSYPGERLLAGELFVSMDELMSYYGDRKSKLHLPFNLALAFSDWDFEAVAEAVEAYYRRLPTHAWPTWTLSNHDCDRLARRVLGEQTRIAAMLLYTLGGTPIHYYGEEIGMRGRDIPPEQATDPQGQRTGRNRDPARTPMQWTGAPGAGFTSGRPWLPLGEDQAGANVENQRDNPCSLLTLTRRLIALRRNEPVLLDGECELLRAEPLLLVYQRARGERRLQIALNGGDAPQTFDLAADRGRILLSTWLDRDDRPISGEITLRRDEGLIIALE